MYEGIFSPEPKTREDMIELICDMPRKYPFVIIEDPLDCDDFDGFSQITSRTGIQIVGDDLFATNHDRLMEGIRKKAANCILISPAQIGTVTEAFQLAVLARENGYGITVSGSRGEEVDICDYAVGLCCGTVRECRPVIFRKPADEDPGNHRPKGTVLRQIRHQWSDWPKASLRG